jgi:protein gp37
MNEQHHPFGIEWARVWGRRGYTSNPVRGCMHRCQWEMPDGKIATCYAKETAEGVARKAYPNGFESLSFHPEELATIKKLKEPSGIFIDSMSDLFGAKVPDEWITKVMDTIRECPQHIFLSLTKNPPRLEGTFDFPENLWVGISAPPTFMFGKRMSREQQIAWFRRGLQFLSDTDAAVKWVSLEPLSFDLSAELVECGKALHWAVIGAASDGRTTHQPDKHDFEMALYAMKGRPVFFKGNISPALAMEVAGGWRAEFPEQTFSTPAPNPMANFDSVKSRSKTVYRMTKGQSDSPDHELTG